MKLNSFFGNRIFSTLLFFALICLLSSCADVTNIEACRQNDDPYGFFAGIWHGIVLPYSLLGSLFSHNIAIYAVNNSGHWYDIGFCMGTGAFWKLISMVLTLLFGDNSQ